MSDRPINFTAPMMRAILEGRKTQTRRPVEPKPPAELGETPGAAWEAGFVDVECPYGAPGDFMAARTADMPSLVGLEIVDVSVERLQSITPADALAEGVDYEQHGQGLGSPCDEVRMIHAFQALWDSIYLEKGFGWHRNPWIWKIEFRFIGAMNGC